LRIKDGPTKIEELTESQALALTSTGSLKVDKRRSQECGKESQK
jgi:hypothetical protein